MLANGGNTFAFFTRNPRGGKAKDIDPQDVQAFGQLAEENHFGKLVAHAPYTMNCCAAKENLRDFAREIMADDLRRLEMTPGNYYNFHPGSHVGQGAEVGISKIAEILNEVLTKDQSTIVLLETMSGKGTEVGRNFEELCQIIDRVELKDKLGVCLDTCHVWDGGYDIVNDLDSVFEEFDRIIGLDRLKAIHLNDIVNDLDGVLAEFDRVVGLERLKAVHLNDSMNPLGSHKDRHARIGEGEIGLEALVRVINHPATEGIPFILETPNDDEGWTHEIALFRNEYKQK